MADCRLTSENISVTIPVTDCHTIPLHLHTHSPLSNGRFPSRNVQCIGIFELITKMNTFPTALRTWSIYQPVI